MLARRALLLLLALTQPLLAASGDAWVTVKVNPNMSITLNSSSFSFPNPTESDYNQGYVEALAALQGSYSANSRWALTIHTDDTDLGTLGGNTKPLSDLLWRDSNGGTYAAISQTQTVIVSSNKKASNEPLSIDFRVLLDWAQDVPGSYECIVCITIGSQA